MSTPEIKQGCECGLGFVQPWEAYGQRKYPAWYCNNCDRLWLVPSTEIREWEQQRVEWAEWFAIDRRISYLDELSQVCGDYSAAEKALKAIERAGRMTTEEMKAARDKLLDIAEATTAPEVLEDE